MPLNDLVAEIADSGWLFNNCYQVDATLWRVNLRRPNGNGDWFTDWAEGPTLAGALAECMNKLAEAEFKEGHQQSFACEVPKPRVNLLQALGLKKPIERRL